MNVQSLFEKPIDRPIEGVIKADDEATLHLEFEEYVLTKEVKKRLDAFLSAYNQYEGANGVWISGFFGSGKSHLLKMLALLLENRQIDGTCALELFLPKCDKETFLRGDLQRAVAIPSKSILFNIDQKADVISKTQLDALLAVFVKVFDETCGYYGKQGYIAQFERDLDSRGLYADFKAAYQVKAGRAWEVGREQALLEGRNIAAAYAKVTGMPETDTLGILDKYRSQYKMSIEDFAEQVKAYIDKRGPQFRLNFFVDEVGQYIANNTKLMTNLQTIAESLATKCRGRSWIIVTAQEEMTTVLGEMPVRAGEDFSKIQARFANRLKLTSADVEQVIQKRLLLKKAEKTNCLLDLYQREVNNLRTLFEFADGAQTYRSYRDSEHFIDSYPFVPYQYSLFQASIQNLSEHGDFEGQHSSVGERSMLGVFQQVVKDIRNLEVGSLATFDRMYEGIRTALKTNIQRPIHMAERNLENPIAVRLLKALFLVKYVKGFKASVRNLSILLFDDFGQDLMQLQKKVQEALELLEQQTYIQRNGIFYEFLTDEEKDIEQEIKNTGVEAADVANELASLVFDHALKERKIRIDSNGQDYLFARKLDDKLQGREQELTIHVISSFHENSGDESVLRMRNMGSDELLVVMPQDDRLIRDLLMFKRTEKYIRQNLSVTQQETVKRILTDKGFQNRDRYSDLQQRVKALVGAANLYVDGSAVEGGSGDAQTRILRGFQELILRTYPNRRMLAAASYSESDIGRILAEQQEGLFGNEAANLSEAEQEMLSFIQANSRLGVRTTVKSVLERFERKQYGWPYPAILCVLAKLCARSKVEARADGNLLEAAAIEAALKNTQRQANTILEPQIEFTAAQVRKLKDFYEEFFSHPPSSTEAKALALDTAKAMQEKYTALQLQQAKQEVYPFLQTLAVAVAKVQKALGKPYAWYLTELPAMAAELMEIKETILDPLDSFWHGPQLEIYRTAAEFVNRERLNFSYVDGQEAESVVSMLANPSCFKGGCIQQLKHDVEVLKQKISVQLAKECAEAKAKLTKLKERLQSMPDFQQLAPEHQTQILEPFSNTKTMLETQILIAVVRDNLRRFEEEEYPKLLTRLVSFSQPPVKPEPEPHKPDQPYTARLAPEKVAEPTVEYITNRSISVPFDKAWLSDEADVEEYIQAAKAAFLQEIRKGKRIQV